MSTPPTPLFSRLSQFAIASVDPGKLAQFYSGVLGFRFAFEVGGMHFLEIGGAHLMIGPNQPDQSIGGDAVFYFEPTAWSATEAALEKAGVAFLNPTIVLQKAEGRELGLRAFKDPEGHTLAMFGWRAA
jgi:catechol 2,3-dioxygenase-like lactoylglutathione lyase family enzyme